MTFRTENADPRYGNPTMAASLTAAIDRGRMGALRRAPSNDRIAACSCLEGLCRDDNGQVTICPYCNGTRRIVVIPGRKEPHEQSRR